MAALLAPIAGAQLPPPPQPQLMTQPPLTLMVWPVM
jgi:hypothetical protein